MEVYVTIFFRIISIMILLIFATLFIMGKRPIGELPVFDFLLLVVLGSVVGADIADPDIKHLPTAFAIVVLACLQRLFSHLNLRYRKFRKLITFEPTVVVYGGKLIYSNIKRIHYSADEVLMMLREKEIFDYSKVEYGIVEANGKLSVLKLPQHEAATLQDMKLSCPQSNKAATVVFDGNFLHDNIVMLNMTEHDIMGKIQEWGCKTVKEVLHAALDSAGNLHVSTYHEAALDLFAQKNSAGTKP